MIVDFLIMLPLFVLIRMGQSSESWVRSIVIFKGGDVGNHYSFEDVKFLQTHFSLNPVDLTH